MARSNVILGTSGKERHVIQVEGDPEAVIGTLKNGWGQLNKAREGSEPEWVWVNQAQVLYVEPLRQAKPGIASA